MYFWSIKGLKKSLIEKPLSEYTAFLYLLLFVFFTAILTDFSDKAQDVWGITTEFVAIGAVVIGTIYCFIKNGGSSGSDFLKRYFSIGWVVHVRLAVLFFLPVMIVLFFLPDDTNANYSWYDPFLELSFHALIYWRMGFHIGQVSKNAIESSTEGTIN